MAVDMGRDRKMVTKRERWSAEVNSKGIVKPRTFYANSNTNR